jgi:hypothetical protein
VNEFKAVQKSCRKRSGREWLTGYQWKDGGKMEKNPMPMPSRKKHQHQALAG